MLAVLVLFAFASGIDVEDLQVEYMDEPLGVSRSPRFSWHITTASNARALSQVSYQIVVLDAHGGVVWDSQKVASSQSHLVHFGGDELAASSHFSWKVTVWASNGETKSASGWLVTEMDTSVPAATWISGGATNKQLRKEFNVPAKDIVSAVVHVSGLGYYDMRCNGEKVGTRMLDVGWTDYRKRSYYGTLDLMPHVRSGANAFALTLGNGWFACDGRQPGCLKTPPQLYLSAHIVFANTTTLTIQSDTTWMVHGGPIIHDSLYDGETYDARAETPGWDTAGYDQSGWTAATVASIALPLSSQAFEPIRHVAAHEPVAINEPMPGVVVVDFGQNMAAVVGLRIRGCTAGANVTLRHAEVLMHEPYGPANGMIYTANLRSAKATDVYICKGDASGEEWYRPTFTQHGFRYCEITHLPQTLNEDDIRAYEMHTDVPLVGAFTASLDMLNKIHHNVIWGQKSNLMSVPSDCPQRDERRGWMGDAALTVEEAMYNFRLGALYTAWLNIIRDDQNADGSVADFVPSLGESHGGAPNWQTAYPTILWCMMRYHGDLDIVKNHHAALQRYGGYLEAQYNATGLKNFRTGFNDWVPPPPAVMADHHLGGAFAYVRDLGLLADMSEAIGEQVEARAYRAKAGALREEFNTAFMAKPNNYAHSNGQTEQVESMWLGFAPNMSSACDELLKMIAVNDGHPTTGILGWRFIFEVLDGCDRSDVGIAMNMLDTYPSFGFMIQGKDNPEPATTVWELWDGYKEGPSMNSRNHIMFGSVGGWLHKSVGGLRAAPGKGKEGWRASILGPSPSLVGAHNLNNAASRSMSPYGPIQVEWSVHSANSTTRDEIEVLTSFMLHAIVPVGTTAEVIVIASRSTSVVTESGQDVWKNEKFVAGVSGVTAGTRGAGGTVRFTVHSGSYSFASTS